MPSKGRQYRLRPFAEDDLEEIWLYTRENWSREQADKYVRDVISVIADLAAGRKAGRKADIREGYMKQSAGAHIVFYRVADDHIDIVRILHGRMDVGRHL